MADPSSGLTLTKISEPAPVSFENEPDPFLAEVTIVECPKAVPQPRQRCPVIELSPLSPHQQSANGEPLSTGTVWAGAPYADGAKPTSSVGPRSCRPLPAMAGHAAPLMDGLPMPCGPAVALTPREMRLGVPRRKAAELRSVRSGRTADRLRSIRSYTLLPRKCERGIWGLLLRRAAGREIS